MRLLVSSLIFVVLASAAQAGEAMCEYAHPQHPSWDFFSSCQTETATKAGVVTTKARVANGSSFTMERDGDEGDGARYTVNGRGAQPLDRGGSDCYRTDAERELVCIHPVGTEAPLAAVPRSPETASSAPLVLGGSRSGFCLLKTRDDAGAEALIDYGACQRAENCQVDADSGAASCLTLYVWKNGRENGLYKLADLLALDGVPVEKDAAGCYDDRDGGQVFCFSKSAMAVPETRAPAAAAPAVIAPAATAPPPASNGSGLCRFLKDGREIAASPCQEVDTCDDGICTVSYALETGAQVSLLVSGGKARVIDGIATGPTDWAPGQAICTGYAAVPFRFCYAPGGAD